MFSRSISEIWSVLGQGLGNYALENPHTRIMILRYDREVESPSNESEWKSMPTFEDANDVEYAVNGESLVIKRSLNVLVNREDIAQKGRIYFIIDAT